MMHSDTPKQPVASYDLFSIQEQSRHPDLEIDPQAPFSIALPGDVQPNEVQKHLETELPLPPVRAERNQATDDLIDRFLENPPQRMRTKRVKDEDQSGDQGAQSSTDLDEDLVSETLAKLHLRQDNHQEALRIYQRLRLLFPEKSAYFDAQIQKISEL